MTGDSSREAKFWNKLDGDVLCTLCHQECRIKQGKKGICGVRENVDGTLITNVYGSLIAANVDPIEKKPLYHFLPGSLAYSIATVGCNFKCLHCQNADISQMPSESGRIIGNYVSPEEVVSAAKECGCKSIAYTYTEPTIFFEYAYDVALIAKDNGLRNVFVSNGYIGVEAAKEIMPLLDANNIDLKGDDQFYKRVCKASLEPVLQNIELMWNSGVWVEVTTLIIPGYNDSEKQLRGIADFLSKVSQDIPWHISAFYPMYKLKDTPSTTAETLKKGVEIGYDAGLNYIYAGNVSGVAEDTFCPFCKTKLIERSSFHVMNNFVVDGHCPLCGKSTAGVWS